jgi:hypothetical protein
MDNVAMHTIRENIKFLSLDEKRIILHELLPVVMSQIRADFTPEQEEWTQQRLKTEEDG